MTKGTKGEEADRQPVTPIKGASGAKPQGTVSPVEAAARPAPSVPNSSAPARGDDIVIGRGVTASGRVHTEGGVFVDGVLQGADVECSTLSISRDGMLYGCAKVGRAEIAGNVEGEIRASGEIVLRSFSSVSGRLEAPYIVVHRGASVSGETITSQRKGEAASRYYYAPAPGLGRRRVRIGSMLFTAALFGVLVSSVAFALLS